MTRNKFVNKGLDGGMLVPCPECGAHEKVAIETWMDAATPDHLKTDKQRDRGIVEWLHCSECKKRSAIREWQRALEQETMRNLGWNTERMAS